MIPAVELTCLETRSGNLIFSYTNFIIQDDEERPIMHLRGDMIGDYMVLLEDASRIAQKVRARWDPERRGERLTASLMEHLINGDGPRRRRNHY